jgi:hypothetical protein
MSGFYHKKENKKKMQALPVFVGLANENKKKLAWE